MIFLGCEPENRPATPGKVVREILPGQETISFWQGGQELDRVILWDRPEPRWYEILEMSNQGWQDTRYIQCLLVGINDYVDAPLDYCREDVILVEQYLKRYFHQYQQPCRIQKLLDSQATQEQVKAMLLEQVKNSSQFSTTLFVFSGHGTEQGLRLYDGEIHADELRYYFANTQSSRVLWLLDSCDSGAVAARDAVVLARKSKSAAQPSKTLFPTASSYAWMHVFVGRGKFLLLSARANQEAQDGVFIRALVAHLEAAEGDILFPALVRSINEGIRHYNRRCRPENILTMTPWLQVIQGDIQLLVVPSPKG